MPTSSHTWRTIAITALVLALVALLVIVPLSDGVLRVLAFLVGGALASAAAWADTRRRALR
jgi:hypothetical protein